MLKTEFSASIELSEREVACNNCNVFQLCLPIGIGKADLKLLDKIVKRHRPIKRGGYLFHSGDPFLFIYAVKSGSIKTYTSIGGETQQVIGFQLPGEMLGLDAIDTGVHQCSAKALEMSSVCEIPFHRLEELGDIVSSVQYQLMRLMSKQILHDNMLQVLLCKKTAEERLAAFLVSLSTRFKERGFSAIEYNMSMSRYDIANYLGLAVETISRLFSRFQEEGLITERKKHIRLRDLNQLQIMAGIPATVPNASVQSR